MDVVPLPDPDAVARTAADAIERLVAERPEAVLGLATGGTPGPTYRELVRRHRDGSGPSYAGVRVFLLDEYAGLAADDPRSYRATITTELTDDLGISRRQVHGPDPDLRGAAGPAYERLLVEAGGVDLQLLGIGGDGHLAFNEPGSSLASRTRIKTLTDRTRRDNARFFGSVDDVPRHAVTQGLGTILEARRLLLLATGSAKASAVAAALEGPLSAACPASVVQWHPRATVLLDPAAAAGLADLDHHREVLAHRPAWQPIGG